MGENKDRKFITEKILGRELTFSRALKFALVSLLCGLVFGAAAGTAVWLISRHAAVEERKQEEAEALSRAAAEESRAAESISQENTANESIAKESTVKGNTAQAKADHPKGASAQEETETAAEREAESRQKEEVQPPSEALEQQEPGEHQSGQAAGTEPGGAEPGQAAGTEPGGTEPESAVPEPPSLDKEEVRRIAAEVLETEAFTDEDLAQLYALQQSRVKAVTGVIAEVDCTISETTWFESTVETKRSYSGVILSAEEDEILILTVSGAKQENASLSVLFSDGTRSAAVVKQVSERDGYMVLAVSTEGLGSDFVSGLKAAEPAGQNAAEPGAAVLAAGAPAGAVNSVCSGSVTFVEKDVSITDGSVSRCYCNFASHPEKGTWLFTADGKLLGLGTEAGDDPAADGSCFLLTSSCTSLLESLKKGYSLAYLGITGMDISFDMKYTNIPVGLYVTAVEEESPAAEAGLKRGDIITASGTREIRGLSDFCSFMRNLRPEETVAVKIRRLAGKDEYKELELELTAGTRRAVYQSGTGS